MKIVIAEDEILNQRLTLTLLRRLGHQVHCVSNGRDLVDYLAHDHPDVAFIDIHMPTMNGIEAAREIVRRWRPSLRPLLIALSATGDEQEIADCLSSGMGGFLRKPVTAHTLQESFNSLMERQRQRTEKPLRRFPQPQPAQRISESPSLVSGEGFSLA